MVTKFVLLSVHETVLSLHLRRLFFPWTLVSSSTEASMVSKQAWMAYLLGKSLLPVLMVSKQFLIIATTVGETSEEALVGSTSGGDGCLPL